MKTVSDLTEAVKNRELAEAAVCKPRQAQKSEEEQEGRCRWALRQSCSTAWAPTPQVAQQHFLDLGFHKMH